MGYATLGQIGFEQRLEYAAIGSVTNLASRLCDEAKAGQIIVSQRAYGMVEAFVEAKQIAPLPLKGGKLPRPRLEKHLNSTLLPPKPSNRPGKKPLKPKRRKE